MSLVHEKIVSAMKDIKAIGKDRTNAQQKFKFRGIEDVYNSLQPILAEHELFTIIKVLDDKTEEKETQKGGTLIYRILKIEYTVYTTDGSSVSGVVIGEAMDSGDKATNKAMAIAHKYFLTQLFAIPTGDTPDPDAESHEVMNLVEQHKNTINNAKNLEELKNAVAWCLEIMKEKNIAELHINKFREYANQLREKFKQKEGIK